MDALKIYKRYGVVGKDMGGNDANMSIDAPVVEEKAVQEGEDVEIQ